MLPVSTMATPLDPPSVPFANSSAAQRLASRSVPSYKKGNCDTESSSVSLSVNYLPKKFSNSLLTAGPRRRKAGKDGEPSVPKMGGGVEAFKSGEARMPGENDEDYDGISGSLFIGSNGAPRRLRWNRFKWTLFIANCFVSGLFTRAPNFE
jgi:hypothetical protein